MGRSAASSTDVFDIDRLFTEGVTLDVATADVNGTTVGLGSTEMCQHPELGRAHQVRLNYQSVQRSSTQAHRPRDKNITPQNAINDLAI